MARVIWSDAALLELITIRAYIAIFDAAAANRIVEKLTKLADSLADFPNRGRPSIDGSREMTVVPPYILRYEMVDDVVTILDVRRGARRPRD